MPTSSCGLSRLPALGRMPRLFDEEGSTRLAWSPMADISETEKEYLVKTELPGIKREDVKVSLEAGVLTIEGERKQERDVKGEKTHRIERYYGKFCRSFTLPGDADVTGIRADSTDGMLNVHVHLPPPPPSFLPLSPSPLSPS